ncbi:type II toxin-antitoxin system RelE/ParE family toxin [Rhodohalobacter sp. 8-1]|uniref:type II toxin-antitoxin system RelE/ParE family toxin n=1 Tax=Rhodohalobacter sp. 8-1 TaxID=3131972 RepID=UPI0030EB590B
MNTSLPTYLYRPIAQSVKLLKKLKAFPFDPRKGPRVPEYERDDIREVFHHPYRIIYLMKDERIEILSVIHGVRLLPDEPK